MFKKPKTTQERRYSSHGEKVRPKRNMNNLPENYDDLYRQLQRSWKSHRKTQYKIKDG